MLLNRLLKAFRFDEATILPETFDEESDFMFQYEKDMKLLKFFEESKDFNWVMSKEKMPKVFLVNPYECAKNEEFNLTSLAKKFRGTGRPEWDAAIAGIFMQAVYEWETNQSLIMADISNVFNRDYFTNNRKKRLSHEQILCHMDPWIKIVQATSNEVYLKLNV